MDIPYELQEFKNYPNGEDILNSVTKSQLLYAAYTVGKRGFQDVFSHPYHSNKEVDFRIYLVEAFFCERDGLLYRSPIYEDLDPSEKVSINYFNGLMMAKMFSEQIFGFPWMMHLDVYVKKGFISVETEPGKSRPDLFGVNNSNEVLVVEAKGRRKKSNGDLNTAVCQARRIRNINGQQPKLKVGSMLFENDSEGQIKMVLKDPEDHDEKFLDFDINFSELLFDYYATIWKYIHQYNLDVSSINGYEFMIARIPCSKIEIGIEKNTYEYLKKAYELKEYDGLYNNIKDTLKEMSDREINSQKEQERYFIGKDGIIIGYDDEEL